MNNVNIGNTSKISPLENMNIYLYMYLLHMLS